jgi:hypothetical protein
MAASLLSSAVQSDDNKEESEVYAAEDGDLKDPISDLTSSDVQSQQPSHDGDYLE